MPHFSENPLANLAFDPGTIDRTIHLDGSNETAALARVERLIAKAPPGQCLLLRFPPAAGDGRETLFQPLGRFLLKARRAGRIARCLPVADGAGYVITLPAAAEAD